MGQAMKLKDRPLARRRAETAEGEAVLAEARLLARLPEYMYLTDGELIRLAYWGVSGEPEAR